jgi:hypothetical protein
MKKEKINYKGIVDKRNNPFSVDSWCKEHLKGDEIGSGKPMSRLSINDFQIVLEEGGLIKNIIEPHYEKYATFQAIRWGYAKVEGERIIPTEKWERVKLPKEKVDYSRKRNKKRSSKRNFKNNTKKSNTTQYDIKKTEQLVHELKRYAQSKYKFDVKKYLDNDNLAKKSPEEIILYSFGPTIYRAFRHEKPTHQYKNWINNRVNVRKLLAVTKKPLPGHCSIYVATTDLAIVFAMFTGATKRAM